jgi:CDP-diacylglycerol---glycerol-3-phosphate 3-phosphatidyltransferase
VVEAKKKVHPVNAANAFTFLRVALVPVFAWLLVFREPPAPGLAAAVFVLAAATDGLDGWVARKLHLVSGLGQFLDPLADKLLVGTALVALAIDERLPWWAVGLILFRECFIGVALRLALASKGRSLPASRMGKLKQVFQVMAVLLLTILERGNTFGLSVLYVAVALTVLSGVLYFVDLRRGRGVEEWR